MSLSRRYKLLAASLGILVPVTLGVGLHYSRAADHLDPPMRTNPDPAQAGSAADRNADIADLYVWHAGVGASQTFTAILTFAGPNAPAAGQAMPCDRDVVYSIHIDNTGDAMPDATIEARFAMDDTNRNCFISMRGLPGTTGTVVGRIEHNVNIPGGGRFFAGLRDDAFFFDLQGFRETVSNGRLINTTTNQPYIQNDRDFFSGKNTPAIVLELPLASVRGSGTNPMRLWATTARHAP
jgi:hypothetical protein